MSRRRRIGLILVVLFLGLPLILVVGYTIARPAPPAGGPRIGLSMASSLLPQRRFYEDALARSGGIAVLITPPDDDSRVGAVLETVDALLLAGGDDVDPAMYGGDPTNAGATDRRRDAFEIRLIRAALDRNMPILGICRGVQILNVAHEGTVRNLRADKTLSDRHGIGVGSLTAHEVTVADDTRLADAIGAGLHRVNSFHGQAVDRAGAGLRVCATADDGVIEAIERPDRAFVIGIQWHPEITSITRDSALRLFEAFVRRADAYRTARRVRRALPRAPVAHDPISHFGCGRRPRCDLGG